MNRIELAGLAEGGLSNIEVTQGFVQASEAQSRRHRRGLRSERRLIVCPRLVGPALLLQQPAQC